MVSFSFSRLFAVQQLSAQSTHRWLHAQGSQGLVKVKLSISQRALSFVRGIFLLLASLSAQYRAPCREAFKQCFYGNCIEVKPYNAKLEKPFPRP